MASHLATDHGPWPGPRPYREADRHRFFGRHDEKHELLGRLEAERLVLLTAPSAVGKTSFLRASIVPELRRRRRQALEAQRPGIHTAVIVVRDWPVPDLTDANNFWIAAVRAGIKDLEIEAESYGEQDAAFILSDSRVLSAVEPTGSAFAYVRDLAEATGGITLILDQFEEALQGSALHVNKLSEIIGRLFQRAPDVNMLLSFREEFLTKFIRIGALVGDLPKRTYYLQPIAERTLRDVLTESAAVGNVSLSEDALDELLGWMEASVNDDRATAPQNRRRSGNRIARLASSAGGSVDLLKLQALLLQLYNAADREQAIGEPIAITAESLERLKSDAVDGDGYADGHEIVERALQRFIESLLPIPPDIGGATGLPALDKAEAEQGRIRAVLQMRRASARMGPSFSSGGFKVQQEQAALLARAWREEWEILDLDVNDVEDELSNADLEGDYSDLFTALAPESDEASADAESSEDITLLALSGIAKAQGWTRRGTAIDLVDSSLAALELLREGNVLRRKSLQGHVTYELVHDGFGDALFEWAEEARVQPLDALTSTTSERGTAFRWARVSGVINDIRWRGCWVGPDPERGKRLLIDNVTFNNCDLRGTVFDGCDFRGGAFHRCNLSGTVFWDCSFEGTADAPYLFDGIVATGFEFDDNSSLRDVLFCNGCRLHDMSWSRLAIDNVTVDRCTVNQMTVGNVDLRGGLKLQSCWLLLSDLVGLRSCDGAAGNHLAIDECDLFYCRFDDASSEAAERGANNHRYPDPVVMGKEPELRNVPPGVEPWTQPT